MIRTPETTPGHIPAPTGPCADPQVLQASAGVRALTEEGDSLVVQGKTEDAATRYRHALGVCRDVEAKLQGPQRNAWAMQARNLLDRVADLRGSAHPAPSNHPPLRHSRGLAIPLLLDEPQSSFDYRHEDMPTCLHYAQSLIAAAEAATLPRVARGLYAEAAQLLGWWSAARFEHAGEGARSDMRRLAAELAARARALA